MAAAAVCLQEITIQITLPLLCSIVCSTPLQFCHPRAYNTAPIVKLTLLYFIHNIIFYHYTKSTEAMDGVSHRWPMGVSLCIYGLDAVDIHSIIRVVVIIIIIIRCDEDVVVRHLEHIFLCKVNVYTFRWRA